MINVTKTYLPPISEYIDYLNKIWDSGQLTNNGSLVRELEHKLSNYLEIPNIQYVTNGTIAIQLALKALNIEDEVITTPFTYVATTNAIIWEKCKPIFVDIDENSFCIDAYKIEDAISERTKAILATHVYGYPCNVKKIDKIATKYKLKVIYDAAHCFGVRFKGESLLNYGDISTISFHATKLFHTVEGGAVITKDPKLSQKIWLLKKFGHIGEDEYFEPGINAKNSEFHAAMGLCLIHRVSQFIEYRKEISLMYDVLLSDSSIKRPVIVKDLEYNYSYYPVLFSCHQEMMNVQNALIDNNIVPRRYFCPSLNKLPYVKGDSCPISESISQRILCLPLYYGLGENDINNICRIILNTIN